MVVYVVSFFDELGNLDAYASSQREDVEEMLYNLLVDDVSDIRVGGVDIDIDRVRSK